MNLEFAIKKWKPIISVDIENDKTIEIYSIYMEWLNEKLDNNESLLKYKDEIDSRIKTLTKYKEVKTFLNEVTGKLEYTVDGNKYISTNNLTIETIKKIFGNDFYLFLIEENYNLS